MKKLIIVLIFIFALFNFGQSQYSIQSGYLQNPEMMIGYVDSCAAFWLQTWDPSIGGFYTNINKYGNLIVGIPADKYMLTQSRNAYGLTRAFMLTGDTTYLNYTKNALDFMYQSAWDQTNGGWYQEIDVNGNPIYPSNDKSTFYQLYALLGILAYYEATDDSLAYDWFQTGYQYNENTLWDNRIGYEGYYDLTDYNGSNPRNKSFNATVDAITTYMLNTYLMFDDLAAWTRLGELSNQIIDHLVASMDYQAIGFVERYDSDWNWDSNETMTIMGHVLKAAWCLGRVYQNDPDTSYINAAEKLVLHVYNNGYDHEFGGPYKDYNRVTGQMLMWGNPDTCKAWWQLEQAVTAGLILYDITKDSIYLKMADESLDFYMKFFVDHTYSEVYADRTRYGALAWNENKGSGGKAGYHSIELGYYTYLYGNLFVHENPVTLHYLYKSESYARDILLSPLAITDNRLKISSVLKDGVTYSNFNAIDRILTIPAGVHGHFTVTFELVSPNYIANHSQPKVPDKILLKPNYPNPFNATTNIEFYLPNENYVELKIFNNLGQEVEQLFFGQLSAGEYKYSWNASNHSSGIYYYQLITKEKTITNKLLYLK